MTQPGDSTTNVKVEPCEEGRLTDRYDAGVRDGRKQERAYFARAIGFDPDGPCPICNGIEGCSDTLGERIRYHLTRQQIGDPIAAGVVAAQALLNKIERLAPEQCGPFAINNSLYCSAEYEALRTALSSLGNGEAPVAGDVERAKLVAAIGEGLRQWTVEHNGDIITSGMKREMADCILRQPAIAAALSATRSEVGDVA